MTSSAEFAGAIHSKFNAAGYRSNSLLINKWIAPRMKKTLMASALLAACASFGVQAQSAPNNGGWSGSGEFGFASSTGNSRSENLNAKLGLNQENDQWKNSFFVDGLRSKSQQTVEDEAGNTIKQFNTTANRYDGGASVGYKLDPRSYIVGAARYEHDDFGANLWQGIVSLGYGYIALKDERNELSFEVGPGYKRYRPADTHIIVDNESVAVRQPTESEMVGRGLVNYKYKLTENTSFDDTLLVEAGSKNTYLQNDAGLAVSMTRKLALKVGFQVRHNTDVLPGTKNTDTLTTTNLVYSF
jgi:putative salt-induced outer membrane protein